MRKAVLIFLSLAANGGPGEKTMRRMRSCLAALALIPSAAGAVAGDFSGHGLDGWKEKSFDGHTRYELVTLDDRQVLHASCDGGASVLYHEQRVDLRRHPVGLEPVDDAVAPRRRRPPVVLQRLERRGSDAVARRARRRRRNRPRRLCDV